MNTVNELLGLLKEREQQLIEYNHITKNMTPLSVDTISQLIEKRDEYRVKMDLVYNQILYLVPFLPDKLQEIFLTKSLDKFIPGDGEEEEILVVLQNISSLKTEIFSREDTIEQEMQGEHTILKEKMKTLEIQHKAQGYYKITSNNEETDTLLNFKYDKV